MLVPNWASYRHIGPVNTTDALVHAVPSRELYSRLMKFVSL